MTRPTPLHFAREKRLGPGYDASGLGARLLVFQRDLYATGRRGDIVGWQDRENSMAACVGILCIVGHMYPSSWTRVTTVV